MSTPAPNSMAVQIVFGLINFFNQEVLEMSTPVPNSMAAQMVFALINSKSGAAGDVNACAQFHCGSDGLCFNKFLKSGTAGDINAWAKFIGGSDGPCFNKFKIRSSWRCQRQCKNPWRFR
jgi:hypothetical protein